jgi:hypothetical protein
VKIGISIPCILTNFKKQKKSVIYRQFGGTQIWRKTIEDKRLKSIVWKGKNSVLFSSGGWP